MHHAVFVFLCLVYFTWQNALQFHPCCANDKFSSFLRLDNNVPLYIYRYIYHNFFIHLSIDGHLSFSIFCLINDAAIMNMGAKISLQNNDFVSFGYILRSGIARSCGNSIFNFLTNFHTVCHSGCSSLHTHHKGSLFSTSSPTLVICYHFDNSHPNKCELIYHCGFDLSFPDV